MRKLSSILLKIIAGFFFYMVSVLAFVNEPPTGAKLVMLIGFSVPAVVALGGGLALNSFRNWRRDTGVVLISTSGTSAFLIFTFACFLLTEEFRKMIRPDTLKFFSDYLTGGGTIVGFAVFGWLLVKANKEGHEQSAVLDSDSAARRPRHELTSDLGD